jgi:hypothetical protein
VARSTLYASIVLSLFGCTGSFGDRGPRPDAGVVEGDGGTHVADAAAPDARVVTPDAGSPACEEVDDSSALVFDGVNDQVTMGRAATLGLERFTVEAWVRRDGAGRAMGTGVGGLSLVPIAGKGRGEADGSNVDCNYAFGFSGDVLGADFEDMATGGNHPVLGHTAVSRGEWHHVAATYDGTTWRLFLDGQLDGSSRAAATPRADSIQHFALGTALDSMGVAAGRLHGALDEVRVWDHARTGAEIAASMYTRVAAERGLLARWGLDDGDGGADTVGSLDGTISGATFVRPGVALDLGSPPALVVVSPREDDAVPGTSAELRVAIDDASDVTGGASRFAVTFHVRELTAEDDFTVVVLPDTQFYTTGPSDAHPDRDNRYFADQTRWVMAHRDAYRIVAVLHNGDIVDDGRIASQWAVADHAMSLLEAESTELPDGMPYGIAVGNHEEREASLESYNRTFGVDRFRSRAYYGGHYGDTNDDNWFTFSAGGLDFVVVDLRYDTTQDAALTTWAHRIFEQHPNAFGVLNSHYILNGDGTFGAQGAAIHTALRDVPNLQLMTCGHVAAESRRSDTFEGHTIHSMLADYQGRAAGGAGYMRIWEFSPANDELTVRSYSPTLDRWETDANSEYTLRVDLSGAGGAFRTLAAIDPATDDARATFDGLEPGHTYEWFATVSDCTNEVRTPVTRFTTAP